MLGDWVGTSLEAAGLVALSMLAMYASVLVLARIGGLRSFAEMSAFDFAMTVALGTIVASTAVAETPTLLQGAVALATIFALRFAVAYLRVGGASPAIDNTPLVLMRGGEVNARNLRRGQMTYEDLMSRLRAANVSSFSEVRVVVLETTGTVSVITESDEPFDQRILSGVER